RSNAFLRSNRRFAKENASLSSRPQRACGPNVRSEIRGGRFDFAATRGPACQSRRAPCGSCVYWTKGSGAAPKIFRGGVDYCPFLSLYSRHLVPSEGAALRALKCGDDRDRGGGDAPAQSRDRSGDIRPVGAVAGVAPRKRAPAAQAAFLVPAPL